MAEALCVQIFEEKVVASLPRQYRRSDNKLTASERERLSHAFQEFWRLLMTTGSDQDIQDQLAMLPLKEVFLIRELAIFNVNNIREPQQREIARQMEYGPDAEWDGVEFDARVMKLLISCNRCLENKGKDRCSLPDQTPLGLFGVFDHWQEYMEYFE
jgi:hypothetical protein